MPLKEIVSHGNDLHMPKILPLPHNNMMLLQLPTELSKPCYFYSPNFFAMLACLIMCLFADV